MSRPRLLLLLLLLLAFALRLTNLDVQSFWGDEGSTAAMAGRSPLDIVQRSAADISPPLYYLLYRAWAGLAGDSEWASRALSVAASLLTVALTAALGRRVGGWRVAALAALASAISPFALYYAQEARMYALVTMLGAASWLLFLALWPPRRRSAALPLLYVLLNLAILFTQYFGIAVIVAQNVAWLWATLRARRWTRRHWQRWTLLQAAVGLLFLPWFLYVRSNLLGWPATSAPLSPAFVGSELFRIVAVGLASEQPPLWVALGFALLLLLGGVAALRGRRAALPAPQSDPAPSLPLFISLVPVALMLLLSLDRPFWNPKFILLALPGYHLLLGQGGALVAEAFARRQQRGAARLSVALAATFLLVATAPPLRATFFDTRYWRDDYRAIARTVAAQAGPEDAVLLSGAGQREIFDYYYAGALPRYALPSRDPMDEAATRTALETIAARHRRLFVVWWAERDSDPAGFIPTWLGENGFEAGSRWFGNVRLASYRLGEPPPLEPLALRFEGEGGALTLQGAVVEPTRVVSGEVVALSSQWQAEGALPPLTFFAQLLDGANQVVAQYDGSAGAAPVAQWGDEPQALRLGLPVSVGTPPGDYALIVGAYRADSGLRLRGGEGDFYRLGTVRVERPLVPPTVEALALPREAARAVPFGGLRLVGAQANRLGSDHAPHSPLAPGEPLSVRLVWQALADRPAAPPLTLRLLDGGGRTLAEWPWQPSEGHYPTEQWLAGELVRDLQVRFLPSALPPGPYTLQLGDGAQQSTIGTLTVR